MLLGLKHKEGHKSVPKKSQIPAAEPLSHFQCLLPPSPPSLTCSPPPPPTSSPPPSLPSLACQCGLPWLTDNKRHKNPLIPPPPFLSAEMSHFLARASVAGPLPGDTLLFIARFHPRRGESGKAFSEKSTHTHT